MWILIIVLLVWIIYLCFDLLGKDAEYLGTISSLKQAIERRDNQIRSLEKQIKHLENQDRYEPEV